MTNAIPMLLVKRHVEKGRTGFLLMDGIRHVATVYGTLQEAHIMAASVGLLQTLEVIRDQTYVDAEGPELRAQNEANHRRASEAIRAAKGEAS